MKRNNTIIELIIEKTGDVKRVIYFRRSKDFNYFLNSFKRMRYPGYDWRYKNIRKKQESNNERII